MIPFFQYRKRLILFALFSIALHLIFYFSSSLYVKHYEQNGVKKYKRKPIKIDVVKRKPQKKADKRSIKAPMIKEKQATPGIVVETEQIPTKTPKKYRFLGKQDHQTDKETKVKAAPRLRQPLKKRIPEMAQPQQPPTPPQIKTKKHTKFFKQGKAIAEQDPEKEILKTIRYENLLPNSQNMATMPGGSPDTLPDDIVEGDSISLNTKQFKYVSYFSSIKHKIELVWKYPETAYRKGMQGETGLEITIGKDGQVLKVIVIKSSGYPILDNEAVATIRNCSPFNPIPENLAKQRLVITGTFVYRLSYFSVD